MTRFLAALARTEDDPDFTIKLAGYTWRVHLEVLAGTSTFFESLQRGAFKVSAALASGRYWF